MTPSDQFVVEYTGKDATLQADVAAVGGTVVRLHPAIGIAIVSGITDAQAALLAVSPGVRSATRDVIVQWIPSIEAAQAPAIAPADAAPATVPDPTSTFFYAAFQWDMRAIHAQDAWPTGFQGQGVKVAIIDTGIDDTHAELTGKVDVANSVAFVNNVNPAPFPTWGDDNFHGTHVASTVAGNLFAMASVAPQATLMAIKVLNSNGSGSFANVIAGILFAADHGANVINMSLGAYFPKSSPGGGRLNGALAKAVNYATSKGVLVVCAAGNNGADLDHNADLVFVPAQSGTAFAVGATGPTGQTNFDDLAIYSNFGVSGPAVVAPGGGVGRPGNVLADLVIAACSHQTVNPGLAVCRSSSSQFYVFAAGTSMASPHAAGVAALILSEFGPMSPGALRTRLEQSADDLGKPGVDPI
ncbi:MAG TPA: S8 family serine peptidase, partial [Gemmatimonadales bacterium]|nr:S8 family serine peptidase [Gemmatimonadales bacterium]